MKRFEGAITAMVTPFSQNGEVDYGGLRNNVRFQIKEGISGLLPLGTTGETPTLSAEEKEKVAKAVIEEAGGKVPVLVGTGSYSTKTTIEQTKKAKELGADAALIVSPYYNKPTQEGLYLHFKSVAESVDIPIIIYNIQGRTGVNIETGTLLRLSSIKNIIGVKEASGNINQMMDVINQLPKDFVVLSGDDSLTLPLMSLGGRGVISVVSNLLPKKVSRMVELYLEGKTEEAKKLHYELLPLFRAAFIETNPMPIKAAMSICGMPAGKCRLPLCDLQPQNEEKLKNVLVKMGLVK